jgi:hypothetical protein
MPDYHSAYDAGEYVGIADIDTLLAFQRSWKWHHPLSDDQLAFAGKQHHITGVSYYHGGTPLYEIAGTPGFWHETCLSDPTLAEGYDKEAGVVAADYYTITTDRRAGLPVVIVRDQSKREMLVAFHFDAEQVSEAMRSIARLRSRITFECKYGFSGIYEANKRFLAERVAAPDRR